MLKKIISFSILSLSLSGNVFAEVPAAKKDDQLPAKMQQQILDQMVKVKGGQFMMGSDSKDARAMEKPAHKVILNDFYIGKYEVTQDVYSVVMRGVDFSYFRGSNMPVDTVSWIEIKKFIAKLNTLTGKTFRLPTEAEWEFAAKGGNKSKGYLYSGSNNITDVAWYSKNSGFKTHPVGTKQPNELGLYDMTGNVLEWLEDGANRTFYQTSPVNNPYNDKSDDRSYDMRIMRGGSFESDSNESTTFFRDGSSSNSRMTGMGFRLVMTNMDDAPAPKGKPSDKEASVTAN